MQAVLLWPHTAQVDKAVKTSADGIGIPVLDAEQRTAHLRRLVKGRLGLVLA